MSVESTVQLPTASVSSGLRHGVGAALEAFLEPRRLLLAGMDPSLAPVVDEVTGIAGGGKRLRSGFAWWAWRGSAAAGEEDPAAVLRAVAALELLHGFALVHDDVMDAATTRRGRPAVQVTFSDRHATLGLAGSRTQFGTGAAILVGDLAMVWADELLRCSGLSPTTLGRAFPVWDGMRTEVIAGQYLDLLRGAGGLPGVEGALKVARHKSAGYTVQGPLHLGAAIAGAGPRVIEAYTRIALSLGEAFQLRDDVLGVFGDPELTGKSADDDLREGKQTLLVALAEAAADSRGLRLLRRVLANPDAEPHDLQAVRHLLRTTGALDSVEDRIARQTAVAREAIREAPITSPAREALDALAIAATSRDS